MSMPRLPWPVLAAVVALGAAPPASAAPFPEGVASGDATTTTVLLWTRASQPGHLTLRVSARPDLRSPVLVRRVAARASHGGAVTVTADGLRPGRRYYFRFFRGTARSGLGRFETAPPTGREAVVRFGVAAGVNPATDPRLAV